MFQVFYFFSALIIFVLKPELYSEFSFNYNFFLGLTYLVLISVFLLDQRLKNKNWLRFDLIFLIGYTIVHFQIPFLASIGVEPTRPDFVWLNKDVVNYATWMSLVAINFWILGFTFFLNRKKLEIKNQDFIINYNLFDIILLIFFIGFLSTVGRNFLSGAYNVNNWGGGATYFLLVLEVLLYLRVLYFFKALKSNRSIVSIFRELLKYKIFLYVILCFTVLFFLTGSRGEVLRILLVIAFAYSIYVKKISFKFILISIIIGSFIFTIMGLGRGRDAAQLGDQNLLQRGYTVLQETDKRSNFTDELATSVRIQYRAIDTVPLSHSYLYGVTYIGTLVGVVPFASGFIVDSLNIPYCYQGSARFFTCLGQGNNITYGEGSEVLADLYVNFGLYGTFFFMFLFGALSGKSTTGVNQKNFNYIVIYTVLLITALSINRGNILYIYKDIFYMLLFHYFFSGKLKLRK
ncbi:oligosaccharide repeat unit polymerase [Acinetobacter pseudolwoffii]|uniref:O-antigen polymerase n=1 Tax=Acinetobacter pseudolwoffii TaxID=2053287 RepID=UPI002575F412|nr:O-antigen polymerase [Acinetobacter pseudolwoffii]MDM1344687.1 oligosaccharide repeat unit polymerase [Acinetobacter pseudolwoffii]